MAVEAEEGDFTLPGKGCEMKIFYNIGDSIVYMDREERGSKCGSGERSDERNGGGALGQAPPPVSPGDR